jgi:hypothetical protein
MAVKEQLDLRYSITELYFTIQNPKLKPCFRGVGCELKPMEAITAMQPISQSGRYSTRLLSEGTYYSGKTVQFKISGSRFARRQWLDWQAQLFPTRHSKWGAVQGDNRETTCS